MGAQSFASPATSRSRTPEKSMLVRAQPPDASTPLGAAALNGLPKPRYAVANADGARAASEPRSPGGQRRLTILHFNDVYEIDARAREPVGGISRFTSLLASYASEDPCVIFSGDFLAPSLLSTETHGMHMIPFFNRMNIKACVLGNHDFDHGLEHTAAAMAAANFPFLLSNAVDLSTGKQLAGAARTLVLEHSGVRIGFIGLIEEEWLATLACIEPSQVRYTDYVAVARELEPRLRAEEGCELVVALTHCRLPNDRRLAAECPGLDLILGGHDHDAFREVVHGVPLVKSGTDFRELTKLVLTLPAAAQTEAAGAGPAGGAREPAAPRSSGRRCEVAWERLLVTSDIPEDAEAAAMVAECGKELAKSMGIVVAELGTPLDFRFAHIRTRETNGSNFIADVLRGATPAAEIALVNCGTLRADDVLPPGPLTVRDLATLLPMLDEMCVLGLSGQQLLDALENSVSMWPKLEGRFLAVSGVRFAFDGREPAGARIDRAALRVGGEPLELSGRVYSVLTKNYMRSGKDGFGCFAQAEVLVDSEHIALMPVMIRTALGQQYKALQAALAHEGANRTQALLRHAARAVVDGRIVNTAEP